MICLASDIAYIQAFKGVYFRQSYASEIYFRQGYGSNWWLPLYSRIRRVDISEVYKQQRYAFFYGKLMSKVTPHIPPSFMRRNPHGICISWGFHSRFFVPQFHRWHRTFLTCWSDLNPRKHIQMFPDIWTVRGFFIDFQPMQIIMDVELFLSCWIWEMWIPASADWWT